MKIESTEELIKTFKEARENSGMSQRKLAKKANVSNATICYFESGELTNIKLTTIIAIADALGLNLEVS